uniref:DUF429 domain-containing protein n=1 Tax=Thermosphaera aggregans TaxID=54254 RepID=A0A7C2BL82_9CREN
MVNFAGLDLSAKKSNPSGIAVVDGSKVLRDLTLVFGDDEILSKILLHKPVVVAVDAPLTFTGEPFRQVDRLLLQAGFRVFPTTFKYMRELSERAGMLKKALEVEDVVVVETHPTSALKSSKCESYVNLFQSFGLKPRPTTLRSKHLVDALVSSIVSFYYYNGLSVSFKEADGEIHLLPKIC